MTFFPNVLPAQLFSDKALVSVCGVLQGTIETLTEWYETNIGDDDIDEWRECSQCNGQIGNDEMVLTLDESDPQVEGYVDKLCAKCAVAALLEIKAAIPPAMDAGIGRLNGRKL